MPDFDYDLLVIGGGPGGSTAATVARGHGLRTLVAEKAKFPRFHIGESLLPAGNAVLQEIGVWPQVEAAGFMPKFGAEFHYADGSAVKTVDFSTSLIAGLDRTFQVERARFDELLLNHAGARGATIRQSTPVTQIERIDNGYRVTLGAGENSETLRVSWVIDATGRDQNLSGAPKHALDPVPFPKRIAIYSHFHGVKRAEGPAGGNVVVVRIKHGWGWLIPLDATRTSVGLVATAAAFKAAGQSPTDYFQTVISTASKLHELMGDATAIEPFHTTSDYSFSRHDLAQDRLLLVGDAGGFLDPIFSSGVHLATWTGKVAADLVARAHAAKRPLHPGEQRAYTRLVKRHTGVFQKLITAFYDEAAFEVFMCQDVPFNLSPGLTSIVAGHTDLNWSLWWRFKIFLLVCRLQRRWRLVR
ncbi:NAD(P)/FAD-dependent oxidoreductase [Synoicihabitans lomoniglobus]|uniref:NAD(P)/FAD-dependent oxidoreductase n=1 Tax=Synoicihabitans lomoniglobus TaxID=2909285 RepID=A0AAE9ZW20_9BACT|nr:tryptophan 7-halogenase [Opitutaceae bacterium LMO-M01]WED64451.1 NAD(P)/FAD-dependent oxidoreductase [Opitutaceae bacterium LMO-M01]